MAQTVKCQWCDRGRDQGLDVGCTECKKLWNIYKNGKESYEKTSLN